MNAPAITDCKSRTEAAKIANGGKFPTPGVPVPAYIVIAEGNSGTMPVCIIEARGDTYAIRDVLKTAGLRWASGVWSRWLRNDEVAMRDSILTTAGLPVYRIPASAI